MFVISHLGTDLGNSCDTMKRGKYVYLYTNLYVCKMCRFKEQYLRPNTVFPILLKFDLANLESLLFDQILEKIC